MGHLISKLNGKLKQAEDAKLVSNSEDFKNKLYKPLAEFAWKDASAAEIKKESIAHYATRFPI